MRRILRHPAFPILISALIGAGVMLLVLQVAPNILPPPPKTPGETWALLESLGLPLRVIVAIGMWVVFSIYWGLAARGAASPQQAESRGSRWVHEGLISAAQLLVLFPVPGLRARFLPLSPWVTGLGFVVMAGSLALAVWSRRTLGRFWSGAIATNAGHELVRSGPYGRVRHPIYTALLGLYLGTAIVSGEVHALLGLAIALAAYARKIRLEEAHLRGLFGAEYEAYARETAALIPGVF